MSWIQPGDLPFLLGFAGAVVVITAAVSLLVGRRLARRSKRMAVIACAAVCPLLFGILALVALLGMPKGPAPNDVSAYMFGGLMELALVALPIAALTSAVLILRKRPARPAPAP